MATESMAVSLYLDMLKRGKSYADIAERYDVDAHEVYKAVQEYYESKDMLNESQYRMLQLERLEKLIDAAYDLGISAGSLDHIDTMLRVLQEISKLLGLYKQKTVTEINVVDQRQQVLVINYLDAVTETLKIKVLNTITSKKAKDEIVRQWDEWIANAASEPLKAIESETVRV